MIKIANFEKASIIIRRMVAVRVILILVVTNVSSYAQIDYLVGDNQIKVTPNTSYNQRVLENEPSHDLGSKLVEESPSIKKNESPVEKEFIHIAASENVTVMIEEEYSEENKESETSPIDEKNEQSDESSFSGGGALTQKFEEYQDPKKSFGIHYRYLGVLSQLGVEKSLKGRFSMGLYYGRYVGKVAGTDDLGFIPDLHQVALQTNIYLGREGIAMTSGPVIRFAIHANQQKENDIVKSVQVDGVDVIVPGQTRYGTLLGIGYSWQKNWFNVSVGAEYLTLGPLKNLVPLAVSVGVAF